MPILQYRIFLSHSNADHDLSMRLVSDLRQTLKDDQAVWYDQRGGHYGGDDWWLRIEQELQARNVFIVVLSPDSVSSVWINDELELALRRKNHPDLTRRMRIIPILSQPCSIWPELAEHQMISFLPGRSYAVAFQEVLGALGLPSALTTQPERLAERFVLKGHTGMVRSVSLSGDGYTLASGSSDRTIKLWNVQTGQLLRTLTGHTSSVYCVAWSADGYTLASASGDKTIILWDLQTQQARYLLKGHTSYVQCIAWSADGRMLVSASADRTIKLWNAQTGQLRQTLMGHEDAVYSVAWSADELTLASGSGDYTVRIWNAQTGQLRHTLSGHKDTVYCVAWSADGYTLASSGEQKVIKLWHTRTGQLLHNLPGRSGPVYSLLLSADGQTLISGNADHTISIWSVQAQDLSAEQRDANDVGVPSTDHPGTLTSPALPTNVVCCYSREDTALFKQLKAHVRAFQQELSAFWYDHEVDAPVSTEAAVQEKLEAADVILLLLSPAFLHTGYGASQEFQSVLTRQQHGTIRVIPVLLRATSWKDILPAYLQVLPLDGRPVAHSDEHTQEKLLYQVVSQFVDIIARRQTPPAIAASPLLETPVAQSQTVQPQPITSHLHVSAPTPGQLYLSNDSQLPLAISHKRASEQEQWTALYTFDGHTNDVSGVTFVGDGLMLVSVSGNRDLMLKRWHVRTGQLLRTFTGESGHKGTITAVAWNTNGLRMATGSYDKTIRLWNTQTGEVTHTLKHTLKGQTGHRDAVTSLAWSPDGLRLASGCIDGSIKLWHVHTGQLLRLLEGHTGYVSSVAWSSDGMRLASGSIDGTMKLWHTQSGALTLNDHKDALWSVAWSPDGHVLASGSADRTIKLWNTRTGQLLHTLRDHTDVVTCVAWSPDGQTLASSSVDRTIKLWNPSTGQLHYTLNGHAGTVHKLCWSADGLLLASGSADKTAKLWHIAPSAPSNP
jgi:WD40 repeat protein